MIDTTLFTSESVSEGHPDKMADQISDAVLDAILAEDPNGRVACETLLTTGMILVAGEITVPEAIHTHFSQLVEEEAWSGFFQNGKLGALTDFCGGI